MLLKEIGPEATRDGHWIYRWLRSEGIDALEIDSSSGRKNAST